jgi:hypothetical protein
MGRPVQPLTAGRTDMAIAVGRFIGVALVNFLLFDGVIRILNLAPLAK